MGLARWDCTDGWGLLHGLVMMGPVTMGGIGCGTVMIGGAVVMGGATWCFSDGLGVEGPWWECIWRF